MVSVNNLEPPDEIAKLEFSDYGRGPVRAPTLFVGSLILLVFALAVCGGVSLFLSAVGD